MNERESIEMQELRFGFFPKRFIWKGNLHTVKEIRKCGTHMAAHIWFDVRTDSEQSLNLRQNIYTHQWTVRVASN